MVNAWGLREIEIGNHMRCDPLAVPLFRCAAGICGVLIRLGERGCICSGPEHGSSKLFPGKSRRSSHWFAVC
jgi:hypothetical protein